MAGSLVFKNLIGDLPKRKKTFIVNDPDSFEIVGATEEYDWENKLLKSETVDTLPILGIPNEIWNNYRYYTSTEDETVNKDTPISNGWNYGSNSSLSFYRPKLYFGKKNTLLRQPKMVYISMFPWELTTIGPSEINESVKSALDIDFLEEQCISVYVGNISWSAYLIHGLPHDFYEDIPFELGGTIQSPIGNPEYWIGGKVLYITELLNQSYTYLVGQTASPLGAMLERHKENVIEFTPNYKKVKRIILGFKYTSGDISTISNDNTTADIIQGLDGTDCFEGIVTTGQSRTVKEGFIETIPSIIEDFFQ